MSMKFMSLDLDELIDHPSNSNVMPEDRFAKLRDQMAVSKRYPPIVVRPMECVSINTAEESASHAGENVGVAVGGGGYQILDGHHRVRALREIGCQAADCVVWAVDDDEALVLLATLNRLEGRDDPRKRALLLAELDRRFDRDVLRTRLPEQREELEALLALNNEPAQPRQSLALENLPVAVHFFLLPEQRRVLESRLRTMGGTREEALMAMVEGVKS